MKSNKAIGLPYGLILKKAKEKFPGLNEKAALLQYAKLSAQLAKHSKEDSVVIGAAITIATTEKLLELFDVRSN
jgi:hypothetical protein